MRTSQDTFSNSEFIRNGLNSNVIFSKKNKNSQNMNINICITDIYIYTLKCKYFINKIEYALENSCSWLKFLLNMYLLSK